jgi:signal transduction histidine kinase
MKDKIFQPKFTTKDSGSGLGLAIASNMLESMNGRLYFDSEENIGTNFYIELDNIRPKTITLD